MACTSHKSFTIYGRTGHLKKETNPYQAPTAYLGTKGSSDFSQVI